MKTYYVTTYVHNYGYTETSYEFCDSLEAAFSVASRGCGSRVFSTNEDCSVFETQWYNSADFVETFTIKRVVLAKGDSFYRVWCEEVGGYDCEIGYVIGEDEAIKRTYKGSESTVIAKRVSKESIVRR